MPSPFSEAHKRQLARLDGAKPLTTRSAIAMAKSQAYQDAADWDHRWDVLIGRAQELFGLRFFARRPQRGAAERVGGLEQDR